LDDVKVGSSWVGVLMFGIWNTPWEEAYRRMVTWNSSAYNIHFRTKEKHGKISIKLPEKKI
jgi:hypothetical protein